MDAQPVEYMVRLSDPGEIAAGLPHLLGFRPSESVVLIGLAGSGGRVGMCVRADLPPPPLHASVAAGLARAMATSDAHAAVVAVVSEAPDGPDLPRRDLVHELVLSLDAVGLAVADALLVRAGRWWSYDCPHACCAPGGGTPLPGGVSALEVASVAAGQVLAEDRDELLARVAPLDGPAAAAMAGACLRVGHELVAAAAAQGPAALAEEGWAAVLEGLAAVRPGSASRRLTDDEVARIGWALRDADVRDRSLELVLDSGSGAVELLWAQCTPRLPPPLDAAPATLLAVCAWLRGDGALAGVALDRAADGDPDYALAGLLRDGLASCMAPSELRSLLTAAAALGRS